MIEIRKVTWRKMEYRWRKRSFSRWRTRRVYEKRRVSVVYTIYYVLKDQKIRDSALTRQRAEQIAGTL